MSDDIVAELDRWMTTSEGRRVVAGFIYRPLIQRARDEIAALREDRNAHAAREAGVLARIARAEALEEAAREVEKTVWQYKLINGETVIVDGEPQAKAIRALKG